MCISSVAIFLIYWIVIRADNNNIAINIDPSSPEICLTPACIHLTSSILKTLEPSVDPCEDFYRFTCGGGYTINRTAATVTRFTSNLMITDEQISQKHQIQHQIQVTLKEMFEKPMFDDELRSFRTTQKYYNACMIVDRIGQTGDGPLLEYFKSFWGWPLLLGDKWREKNLDLEQMLVKLNKISGGYLFEVGIGFDKKDTRTRAIYIREPKFQVPREELVRGWWDSRLVRGYHQFIVELALAFGAQNEYAVAQMEDVTMFMINLAKYTYDRDTSQNETVKYNPMTLMELQRNFTDINWEIFFQYMFGDTIGNDVRLVVENLGYLKELGNLIRKTPLRYSKNSLNKSILFKPCLFFLHLQNNCKLFDDPNRN